MGIEGYAAQNTFSLGGGMNTQFSSIVSEFDSEAQEASYNAWFVAKVEASLADPRPSVPHDQAMAQIEAIIVAAEQRRKSA